MKTKVKFTGQIFNYCIYFDNTNSKHYFAEFGRTEAGEEEVKIFIKLVKKTNRVVKFKNLFVCSGTWILCR